MTDHYDPNSSQGAPSDPSRPVVSGPAPSPDRPTVRALVDRIEKRVSAAVTKDFEHAMVAITAMRNTVETMAGAVRRLDERMARLEQVLGAPGAAAAAAPGQPLPPPGGALAVAESNVVAAHLAQLERRLVEVDDRAAQEILDAIVAVAQHLEAVQTATAWAIVQEVRTG